MAPGSEPRGDRSGSGRQPGRSDLRLERHLPRGFARGGGDRRTLGLRSRGRTPAPTGSALPCSGTRKPRSSVSSSTTEGRVEGHDLRRFPGQLAATSGALGYLEPDAFSIHPQNFAEGATVPRRRPGAASRTPSRGWTETSRRCFIDRDGSVSGEAGSAIVVDNPFLLTDQCTRATRWNAHVCPAGYVSLWMVPMGGRAGQAVDPDAAATASRKPSWAAATSPRT